MFESIPSPNRYLATGFARLVVVGPHVVAVVDEVFTNGVKWARTISVTDHSDSSAEHIEDELDFRW